MRSMPSCQGISVLSPDELDEKIVREVSEEVATSSDEAIEIDLAKFYAKHPEALVEHIQKKSLERVRARIELAKHLDLDVADAARLIGLATRVI